MAKKKKQTEARALMLHDVRLSLRQDSIVTAATPPEFIKSKPGRGGKTVTFVEGGYIVNQLNAAFSPIGWDFDIVTQGFSERKTEKSAEGEVWVVGRLTIIDHKNGHRVSKTQYGQHPVHMNVPIGDAYKAAATDAMKKCASLFGFALDVYWGQLDAAPKTPPTKKEESADLVARAKAMIMSVRDPGVLEKYSSENLAKSTKFTKEQKAEIQVTLNARMNELIDGIPDK